jgi:hypothetical protein
MALIGSRSRRHAELLDALRTECATTRAELGACVARAVVRLEQQRVIDGERRQNSAIELLRSLDALHVATRAHASEVVGALDRLTDTWHELALDARDQQDALMLTLEQLSIALEQHSSAPAPSAESRVVGGTIDATHSPAEHSTDMERSRTVRASVLLDGVEVRCRFADNHWVSGFEVCDVFNDTGKLRYRLRRRSDGYILPTLFDEGAIREAVSWRRSRDDEWTT